jgi:hypothetical protein
MKKERTVEVNTCDWCGEETYGTKCLRCGKDVCYECKDSEGVEYPFSLHFSGSSDGWYCNKCNDYLTKKGDDVLHNAYRRISRLRKEEHEAYERIRSEGDETSKTIERLRGR